MVRATFRVLTNRYVLAILCGSFLGGFLGFASAQDGASGWLNEECAKTCATNGYDAKFCAEVCWVQDPAKVAEADNLDWKCVGACGERGGTARTCGASCRRY